MDLAQEVDDGKGRGSNLNFKQIIFWDQLMVTSEDGENVIFWDFGRRGIDFRRVVFWDQI